ncbi:MAG: FtsX-like permease family protein [Sedimentisphaerales bacterium]|nr:FtsX-like permease family protein [Sedimentisphaerales bacterium]
MRTQMMLDNKKTETREKMRTMEEDIKKAMQKLGFNIVILPKEQNLSDWYAEDYGAKYMPEHYVAHLAQSKILTIEHLTPRIRRKVNWPETQWAVILVGLSDSEGCMAEHGHDLAYKPISRGRIVLGHEVHQGLGLKVSDEIRFMGKEFVVDACRKEMGTEEDMTVWMDLQEAQELLNKEGWINEILALECRSAWANLPKIRAEITRILPETQVVEKSSDVLAKIHAYIKVEEEGKTAIEREQENISRMKATWKRFAFILGPLVLVISVVWISLLAAGNVRRRQVEIGILRTLGFRSWQILYVFLSRAVLMGLLGGLLGFIVGRCLAHNYQEPMRQIHSGWLFSFGLFGLAVLGSVAIAVAASWIPAMRAARLDPAVTLREE